MWRRTLESITRVYELTNSFPPHEIYGLTSQIRRAAISIAPNISEGTTSGYDVEYSRFIRMVISSANEVAAGFEIAKRFKYCTDKEANDQIAEANEIASILQGLGKSLSKLSESSEPYTLNVGGQTTRH